MITRSAAFLLLLLPVQTSAQLDFIYSTVNSLLALVVNENNACESLTGGVFEDLFVCTGCQAELVPADDGVFRSRIKLDASCVLQMGSETSVTFSAESDSVNIWEPLPFIGSLQAFDPFRSTITVTPPLLQGVSALIQVESDTHLLADTPTTKVLASSGSVTTPNAGTAACASDGPVLACGNSICFNPTTFSFGCPREETGEL